jgi:large subunit ribosomal protein L10
MCSDFCSGRCCRCCKNTQRVLEDSAIAKKAVSAKDVEVLADLPSREVMLSQLAGLMQAPLVKTAGLLQALPRNTAYGIKALIDKKEQEAA